MSLPMDTKRHFFYLLPSVFSELCSFQHLLLISTIFGPCGNWKCDYSLDSKFLFSVNDSGSAQRSVYTGKELDYAVFVHSLCVLGKLLIYTNGRKIFPIKVRKRKGTRLYNMLNRFLVQCLDQKADTALISVL